MVKNGKIIAVNRVSQHNVGADVSEFVGDAVKLVNAVGLLIDGHDERERGRQVFERWLQGNLVEIIEKHFGGRGAAIHDNKIGFLQRTNHGVQSARVGQIQKLHVVAVKTFQRGIFVVAVAGDKFDVFVFEVLDEIDGKETFADTALAVRSEERR